MLHIPLDVIEEFYQIHRKRSEPLLPILDRKTDMIGTFPSLGIYKIVTLRLRE